MFKTKFLTSNFSLISTRRGTTMIELIIVITIIALLSVLGVNSYQSYLTSARRSEATTALLLLAQALERYFAETHSYESASLENLGIAKHTTHHFYELNIIKASPSGYHIQAIPTLLQANDTECASFTYNHVNEKGITGDGKLENCW